MNPKKQKKENNFPLMARYIKGNVRYLCDGAPLFGAEHRLQLATPQIISVTIDSMLGTADYTLPAVLPGEFTTLEALRANAGQTLLIAAGAIIIAVPQSAASAALVPERRPRAEARALSKGCATRFIRTFNGCRIPGT